MTRIALLTSVAVLAAGPAAAQAQRPVSEVVVTAAPYALSLDSVTTNVDVLKREDLDQAVAGGLGDVLAGLPGVRSSFFGPGASRPVIRGLSGPRVLVLTNGIGQIDVSALSPDHQVASDPQEAERIEVLRGPSALAYGGSAIGGVVNIIDDRIPDAYVAGLHGRALGSYSTVDEGRQASAALQAGLGGGLMITADATRRVADDYDAPVDQISTRLARRQGLASPLKDGSTVVNSAVELTAGGVGASYVGDGVWGGLAIKRTDTDYGVVAEEDVTIDLEQTRVDARGGFDLSAGPFAQVKWATGYAEYKHIEFEGPDVGTTFLSDGYEGRLELVQRDRDGWQGAVGAQGLARDVDATGTEALIPSTKIREAAAFILQRLDRDAWGVEGGLRVDRRSLESSRGDRSFTNFTGSLAAFVRPAQGWFFSLSGSRTSRAPTEEELFALGAHPATGNFEVGDATLDKEVSWSLDATAHYGSGPWQADLHGFYVDYRNFIDLVDTAAVDADSGFPILEYREGGAEFYGAEAEASYRLWQDGDRSFRLEGAADYVRGTTDAGPAARIPPYSLTGRGVFEGGWWRGMLEVRRVGYQGRTAGAELPTDGYRMLNASLTVRPFGAKSDLRLFLEGRNLTDAEAREHASFLKDVAPLPGRSVRAGLAYRF